MRLGADRHERVKRKAGERIDEQGAWSMVGSTSERVVVERAAALDLDQHRGIRRTGDSLHEILTGSIEYRIHTDDNQPEFVGLADGRDTEESRRNVCREDQRRTDTGEQR